MGDERMTIQSLRYIVAVAEAGSITEAAKKLHISQPSLSAAVKEAEREDPDPSDLGGCEKPLLRSGHPLSVRQE